MRVGNDVHQLARLQTGHLREHVHEHGVLHDVPVVRREHVLAALVEDGVERVARDVERHRVRARVERHLVQILERINIRQDAAGGRVVLQVVEHAVHLVEFTLGILVLDAELVAVGLADRAGLVGPLIPDVAAQVVDVVRLLLPDPQQLVHGGLPVGAPQRQQRKFFGQVIAVDDAELFDRVRWRAVVLPVGAHRLIGVPDAVRQNVAAVADKDLVCVAHRSAPFK